MYSGMNNLIVQWNGNGSGIRMGLGMGSEIGNGIRLQVGTEMHILVKSGF